MQLKKLKPIQCFHILCLPYKGEEKQQLRDAANPSIVVDLKQNHFKSTFSRRTRTYSGIAQYLYAEIVSNVNFQTQRSFIFSEGT